MRQRPRHGFKLIDSLVAVAISNSIHRFVLPALFIATGLTTHAQGTLSFNGTFDSGSAGWVLSGGAGRGDSRDGSGPVRRPRSPAAE